MERALRSRSTRKKAVRPAVASLLRRGAEIWARDLDAWGLTGSRALMIALAPILATFAILATVPFPGLFGWVIEEDHLVEWSQFVLLLSASLLIAQVGARLVGADRRLLGMLYVLFALGTFFVAGEEISWGQRILGLRTPENLGVINAQQEISVHNIYSLHAAFIYAVMLGGMYGTLMPFIGLAFSPDRRRSTLAHLLIPPLCLVSAFFAPFAYRFWRLVFGPELPYSYRSFIITKFSEITELCLYFALLVFAWLNLRRLRRLPR
jgi:hypothetical protein